MEFEEFKEIDQVKPSDRENVEKGGINIKHEHTLSVFKMSNMANLQKAKVNPAPLLGPANSAGPLLVSAFNAWTRKASLPGHFRAKAQSK